MSAASAARPASDSRPIATMWRRCKPCVWRELPTPPLRNSQTVGSAALGPGAHHDDADFTPAEQPRDCRTRRRPPAAGERAGTTQRQPRGMAGWQGKAVELTKAALGSTKSGLKSAKVRSS